MLFILGMLCCARRCLALLSSMHSWSIFLFMFLFPREKSWGWAGGNEGRLSGSSEHIERRYDIGLINDDDYHLTLFTSVFFIGPMDPQMPAGLYSTYRKWYRTYAGLLISLNATMLPFFIAVTHHRNRKRTREYVHPWIISLLSIYTIFTIHSAFASITSPRPLMVPSLS